MLSRDAADRAPHGKPVVTTYALIHPPSKLLVETIPLRQDGAMSNAPDFRLYHSNALDVLAQLLAHALREQAPGQPLLAADIVLIPQVAIRRWLQSTLAAE